MNYITDEDKVWLEEVDGNKDKPEQIHETSYLGDQILEFPFIFNE